MVTPRWGSSLCLTALLTLAVAPPTGAFAFSLADLPPAAFSEVLALPALRREEFYNFIILMFQSDLPYLGWFLNASCPDRRRRRSTNSFSGGLRDCSFSCQVGFLRSSRGDFPRAGRAGRAGPGVGVRRAGVVTVTRTFLRGHNLPTCRCLDPGTTRVCGRLHRL